MARATQRLIDAERPILFDRGLTMWGYIVLSRLARGDAASQRSLAHDIGHEPSRLIAVLQQLEAGALITRHVDPSDSRARVIAITHAGRERQADAQAAIHAMEDALLADLTHGERDALDQALAHVLHARPPAGG